ncbi:MAG: hypothetical protein ACO3DQ_10215 [Cephaloticoccus sp.]
MHKDTLLPLLTSGRLDAVARRCGGTGQDLEFIRAMENFVYAFNRGGSALILRLTHSTHRSRDEVVAELEFVDYLARHGVDVAHPVPSANGELIETFAVPGS